METERPAFSSDLTLFGSWICPFAQRVHLGLRKKGNPFTWVDINLQDKPSWYSEVNPTGKVPAIGYKEGQQDYIVTESLVLLEFLDDYQPEPSLLPKHPAGRAQCRIIINAYNEKIVPLWYQVLKSPDKSTCIQATSNLTKELLAIQSLMDETGPYFTGEEFNTVDAAVLPWLIRLPVLKHYRGYELPEELQKLNEYIEFSKTQPWVQATLLCPEGSEYYSAIAGALTHLGKEPVNHFE